MPPSCQEVFRRSRRTRATAPERGSHRIGPGPNRNDDALPRLCLAVSDKHFLVRVRDAYTRVTPFVLRRVSVRAAYAGEAVRGLP
jgi:hypothetical protein